MNSHKTICYSLSAILAICSICIVGVSFAMDNEGYIMSSQTTMMFAGVVSIWAMTAMLAGKG